MAEEKQVVSIDKCVQWFEAAEDATVDARALSERDIDYKDGKQITAEELKILKRRKQPPVVFNRIKPKVDFMLGEERKQRTDPKAFPRNPQMDEEAANAATDALRYVADYNVFDQVRSDCYEDGIIPGTYGCEVIVEPNKKNPKDYDIKINRIPWDRIFYDPHSRAKDFSDAKYKGVVLWMDEDDALEKFGASKASILTATMESASKTSTYDDRPQNRWADPLRKRVRVVQIYFRQGSQWFYAYYTKAGFLKGPKECPYKDEDGFSECPLEFRSAFVDRDGNRYGQVRQWIDCQDEINKRRSKGLHLINSRQVIAEKGAVDNVQRAREELAKPDGYIEKTPGMGFELVPTADMASGNMQMLAEAKSEIDAQGPNAALSGADTRDLSGKAIGRLQAGASTELFPLIDGLRAWQHKVYRQMWNRIRQYWTAEKWVRVTDDENNLKWVGLNVPSTAGEQLISQLQKEGTPVDEQMMQEVMAHPDAGQQVIQNNVAELDVDIILDDVPDTVTVQQEQFEQIITIYPSVPQQIQPIAFEMLVEASSLRNKKQFLEKLRGGGDDPQQAQAQQQQQQMEMQQQMQMMQLQMEKIQSEIDKNQATAAKDIATAASIADKPVEIPKAETPDIHPILKQADFEAELAMKHAKATKDQASSIKDIAQAKTMMAPPPDTAAERVLDDKGID